MNPLQIEDWAFHLLLLLHCKWTWIIVDIWQKHNPAHNAFTIHKGGFPAIAWRKTRWFKNDVLFLTWISLRLGFPFLDIWGKRSLCHCCETNNHSWDLNQINLSSKYALKVCHVLLDGGNYMENPRFTRVPRLKGKSKATTQATNTLKITWEEPDRTCPAQ